MKQVHYHVASSVDGFIADASGRFDAFKMQGDHVDDYLATLKTYGAVLMGRHTYEVGLAMGVDDPYPWLATHVASRTLSGAPNSRVQLTRDPAKTVRALRETAERNIYLCGGGDLAGQLFAEGLIDRLVLKINPVLLGAGIPLSRCHDPRGLELLSAKSYESGVMLLSYQVT